MTLELEQRRAELVKKLWLTLVDARELAYSLRDTFPVWNPCYSALWLVAEDINQAAVRARKLIDGVVR